MYICRSESVWKSFDRCYISGSANRCQMERWWILNIFYHNAFRTVRLGYLLNSVEWNFWLIFSVYFENVILSLKLFRYAAGVRNCCCPTLSESVSLKKHGVDCCQILVDLLNFHHTLWMLLHYHVKCRHSKSDRLCRNYNNLHHVQRFSFLSRPHHHLVQSSWSSIILKGNGSLFRRPTILKVH